MGAKINGVSGEGYGQSSPSVPSSSFPPVFRGSRVVWVLVGDKGRAVPVSESALSAAASHLRLATGAHVPEDYFLEAVAPVLEALNHCGLLSSLSEAGTRRSNK